MRLVLPLTGTSLVTVITTHTISAKPPHHFTDIYTHTKGREKERERGEGEGEGERRGRERCMDQETSCITGNDLSIKGVFT